MHPGVGRAAGGGDRLLRVEVERTLRGEAAGTVWVLSYADVIAGYDGAPRIAVGGRFLFLTAGFGTFQAYVVGPNGGAVVPLTDPRQETAALGVVERTLAQPATTTPTAADPSAEAARRERRTQLAIDAARAGTPKPCVPVPVGTPVATPATTSSE